MRIIAGEFRSRRIRSVPGLAVRPTPDRLREALFNVLAPRIAGGVFVDAYAGCGAVGLEALSRGAARVIFLEKSRSSIAVIRANLDALGIRAGVEIVPGGAVFQLGRVEADIVFLDPPYDQPGDYEAALEALGGNPPRIEAIAQHAARQKLEDGYGALRRYRLLRQGDNSLSFYRSGE